MSEWFHNLSIIPMALVVFLLTFIVTAGLYWLVMRLATGERARIFKSVSPGMLPPLGIIFGLLIAFLASQVWREFDEAQVAVNREASALRAVVIMMSSFPGEPEQRMHRLIRQQIEQVVTEEWPAMAHRSATLTVISAPLTEALQLALSLTPQGEGQLIAQRQIVTYLENALDARRQRIIISESSINWVKWSAVLVQAVCALLAIAMVHCDNRKSAALAMGLFATGVAVSIVLIAAHRPFAGVISVGPDPLLQVAPRD